MFECTSFFHPLQQSLKFPFLALAEFVAGQELNITCAGITQHGNWNASSGSQELVTVMMHLPEQGPDLLPISCGSDTNR